MELLQITPLLVMEQIEKERALWEDRLGFTRAVGVPGGPELGFVILTHGSGREIMLQTRASLTDDLPACAPFLGKRGVIDYIKVKSLDDILTALKDYPLLVSPRVTFYSARKVFLKTPFGSPARLG